jgi:hypothetical protein
MRPDLILLSASAEISVHLFSQLGPGRGLGILAKCLRKSPQNVDSASAPGRRAKASTQIWLTARGAVEIDGRRRDVR